MTRFSKDSIGPGCRMRQIDASRRNAGATGISSARVAWRELAGALTAFAIVVYALFSSSNVEMGTAPSLNRAMISSSPFMAST
jgi:hypothetical protein